MTWCPPLVHHQSPVEEEAIFGHNMRPFPTVATIPPGWLTYEGGFATEPWHEAYHAATKRNAAVKRNR